MFSHPVTEAHTDHVRQAYAYNALRDERTHVAVRRTYSAFIRQTLDQWAALLPHYTFEVFEGGAMYANSAEMFADVAERRHLWVYRTERDAHMNETHPLFALVPDSLGLPFTQPLRVNDVFRAVHDLMGHVVSGGSFGVNGEMRAWLAHRAMYTRDALPALWCETRGQAAWTNAYAEHAAMPLDVRPFAEQKAGRAPLALV